MGIADYVASLEDLPKGFRLQDRTLRCIDEGTPGGIHLAGQGILLGLENVIKVLEHAQVEAISAHEQCGACALYAKQTRLDVSKSDVQGEQWSINLAKELGVDYLGFMPIESMSRPKQGHIASVTYYDGTGKFDWSNVPGLPVGFVISRAYLSDNIDYAKKEAEVSVSIAIGDHGLGPLITPETPFLLVAVADDTTSLVILMAELSEVQKRFGPRVKVDGFKAPNVD